MSVPLLLDTNVLADVSRGHHKAADALRRHIENGRTVYIAHAAYNELLDQAPNPLLRTHYREMVRDLGIKIAPSGPMAARVGVYADNINHEPRRGQPGAVDGYGRQGAPGDMFIGAQAKALNAELWTHDTKFRRRAPQLGIRLATECEFGGQTGTEDPMRGRRLLGLSPVQVTPSGAVIGGPLGGGRTDES